MEALDTSPKATDASVSTDEHSCWYLTNNIWRDKANMFYCWRQQHLLKRQGARVVSRDTLDLLGLINEILQLKEHGLVAMQKLA